MFSEELDVRQRIFELVDNPPIINSHQNIQDNVTTIDENIEDLQDNLDALSKSLGLEPVDLNCLNLDEFVHTK